MMDPDGVGWGLPFEGPFGVLFDGDDPQPGNSVYAVMAHHGRQTDPEKNGCRL